MELNKKLKGKALITREYQCPPKCPPKRISITPKWHLIKTSTKQINFYLAINHAGLALKNIK